MSFSYAYMLESLASEGSYYVGLTDDMYARLVATGRRPLTICSALRPNMAFVGVAEMA